jgi:hypothetical protein
MNNLEIIGKVIDNIQQAQEGKISYKVIYSENNVLSDQHEFLFFIKPEITLKSDQINLEGILQLVLEKLSLYKLRITDIRILAASYLEKYNIIAGHYGVINALSRKPHEFLSNEAKEKFRIIYGKEPGQENLLGSIEFLHHYSSFTPSSLDELWQNSKAEKLAGGTYCAAVNVEGNEVYLINGFHPKQLIHFTEHGRSIAAFTLSGDLNWAVARNNFIGKTNPAEAAPGSLRNELLMRQGDFGLQAVTSSRNGFHLSAGPVEGLVELIRYCSDYASGVNKTPDDFIFGRELLSAFSREQTDWICNNHLVEHKGLKIRTFDLTEEKNSTVALQMLRECSFA